VEQSSQNCRSRTGLVLGKFMPLTTGHCYLIDAALNHVDRLTILVCSLRREPIDGHLRYRWVKETYPQCNVVHVTDELPSYPHEHPDFWDLWKALILRYAPEVDMVFTSEEYGDKLAETLGCRHICVDLARTTVPISATMVREDPLRYWQYIPPAVRPYYAGRALTAPG
jgi:HTH-type transcriptional regulator, transcriptional repressor of NAD biosynthesis genes